MKYALFTLCYLFFGISVSTAQEKTRLSELDAFWQKVSLAVKNGDFASYQATCHEDAVLVSGVKGKAYPLTKALLTWKEEFEKTRSGQMKAEVEFQFSQRYGDETTAHETGMFRYTSSQQEEEPKDAYIHFEGLLVKKEGQWLLVMEYQKSSGTVEEWKALKVNQEKKTAEH